MPDNLTIRIRAEDLASRNIQNIADSLKKAGVTAEEVAPALQAFGVSVDEVSAAMKGLGAASGSVLPAIPPQVEKAATGFRGMNSSIMQSVSTLRTLRVLSYSTLGLLSVGFYLVEWERLADGIANAALAAGGFDSTLQAIETDAIAASNANITAFGQIDAALEISISLIKDAHARQIALSQARFESAKQQLADERGQIAAIQTEITVRQAATQAIISQYGIMGHLLAPVVSYMERMAGDTKLQRDSTDELNKALTKAQDELDKGAKALAGFKSSYNEAMESGAKSTSRLANEQSRLADALTRRPELPPYINEISRLALETDKSTLAIERFSVAYGNLGARVLKETPTLKQLGFSMPGIPSGIIPAAGAGLPAPGAGIPISFESQRKAALANLATEEESNWKLHGSKMVAIERTQENERFAIEVRYARETLDEGASLDAKMEELEAQHQQKLKAIDERAAKERAKLQQEMLKEITRSVNVALDGWIQGTQRFSQAFEHAWNSLAITAIENIAAMAVAEATGTASATQQLKLDALKHAGHAAAVTFDKAITTLPFPANVIVAPIEAAAILAKGLALASFDQGGVVPQTGIAMVHGGEMVLPRHLSNFVQSAAVGSAPGARSFSNTFNLHHHGDDALKVMEREMVPRIRKALRRGQIR